MCTLLYSWANEMMMTMNCANEEQGIGPGAPRRYAPVDGSSTVAEIAADLRPSADGSAVRTSVVAGGG